MKKIGLIIITLALVSGCRSAGQGATFPVLPEIPDEDCVYKGALEVNWAWWGFEHEVSNALKNQTEKMGGNVVVRASERSGAAYFCPGFVVSGQ